MKETKEVKKLKARARELYLEAMHYSGAGGRAINDIIYPNRVIARRKLKGIWIKIKELDPSSPDLTVEGHPVTEEPMEDEE